MRARRAESRADVGEVCAATNAAAATDAASTATTRAGFHIAPADYTVPPSRFDCVTRRHPSCRHLSSPVVTRRDLCHTFSMSSSFRTAAVLGAGTMGAQIAAHLSNAGLSVVLLDVSRDAAKQGLARLRTTKPDPCF